MNISNLAINRVAIHQVYKLGESNERVRLNNNLSVLEPIALNVIKLRIVEALGEDSRSLDLIIRESGEESTFQKLARMIYSNDLDFIETSKHLTEVLASKQNTTRIPGGIIVYLNGTIHEDKNFIAVMKAESEEGFALDANDEQLNLTYIAELLLTRYQKLYKVAMFIEKEGLIDIEETLRASDEFEVTIYDHNMSNADKQNAARYFYRDFLGCDLQPTNKKLTKDFFFLTKDFINNADISDEEKIDLHSALCNYLKLNRETIINRSEFAQTYFGVALQDLYRQYMNQNNFPSRAIAKDISLIERNLRLRRLSFNTKVKVTAPSDSFNDLVIIESCDEPNYTRLKIKGKIKEQQ